MAERKTPDERAAQLLAAAVEIARADGITAVTRASVARKCGITPGLINRYFNGRNGLRQSTLKAVSKPDGVKMLAYALQCGASRTTLEDVASGPMLREAVKLAAA